jgi:signal transduction histidine kinase
MALVLSTFFENDDAQKVDRDFINRAAHDIRSPLTTLNFTMHALKQKGIDVEAVELMNQAVSRLNNIASDILKTRNEARATEQGVNLNALVNYLSKDFNGTNGNRSAKVSVSSSLHAESAVGDLWQLKRIIYNLVQNSEEAGAENILVDFVERAGIVQIYVKDDGAGIPDVLKKCIGEEGFTTKHNGNGLGLSTAKKMVEAWGGALQVQSSNKGTTILLNLQILQ